MYNTNMVLTTLIRKNNCELNKGQETIVSFPVVLVKKEVNKVVVIKS